MNRRGRGRGAITLGEFSPWGQQPSTGGGRGNRGSGTNNAGRGDWGQRGRGNGGSQRDEGSQRGNPQSSNAANGSNNAANGSNNASSCEVNDAINNGRARYEEAVQHIKAHNQQILAENPIEDSLSDEEEDEPIQDGVLERVFGKAGTDISQLREGLTSGAITCLICLHYVKRTNQVWSCGSCHTVQHLSCVQKWAQDSMYLQRQRDDKKFTEVAWSCPLCRESFSDVPQQYYCYCAKTRDPPDDPWLMPHSCGEVCGKRLLPQCPHTCLMLCHPGACAPCAAMVRTTCSCGASAKTARRCNQQTWSCGRPCDKSLACRQHRCKRVCHTGDCPPCPRTSEQRCQCGAHTDTRPCSQPTWQCRQVCGAALGCGHHSCPVVCHPPGQCPPVCPPLADGPRRCPCGKMSADVSCSETVPVCGDTCDRLLQCEAHRCVQRCHTGNCGKCIEYVTKQCRCGGRSRNTQCGRDFTCEVKCRTQRNCGRHTCNKKCCVECPPCDTVCGRSLQCGQHKCASRCHSGPCFPCTVTVKLTCSCGASTKTVPCGRERVARLPRCPRPCTAKSKCHHAPAPHSCHSGPCPGCHRECQLRLPGCHHSCPAACHDSVQVMEVQEGAREGPWVPQSQPRLVVKKLPCPPCEQPVHLACLGLHGVVTAACSSARHTACRRSCGRALACSNHSCDRACHALQDNNAPALGTHLTKTEKRALQEDISARVAGSPAVAGPACPPCERSCRRPRACHHPCVSLCHPGPCPPCLADTAVRCHCSIITLLKPCHLWTATTDKTSERGCGNPCHHLTTCGDAHGCRLMCHPGPCSPAASCTEPVPVRCKCGRRRKEIPCNTVGHGAQGDYAKKSSAPATIGVYKVVLPCDAACNAKKEAAIKAKEEAGVRKASEEAEKHRQEIVEFERRRTGGGSKKKRANAADRAAADAAAAARVRSEWRTAAEEWLVRYGGLAAVGAAVVAMVVVFISY